MSAVNVLLIRARRQVAPRGTALVLGSLMVTTAAGVIAPVSSAAQAGAADHAEQERQDHQVELAMQLDPATASSEQLIAALTVLDQFVGNQIALVNEAGRSQQDAERRLAERTTALSQLQAEHSEVTNALRAQAVDLYLDPAGSDRSIRLLKAGTIDDAEQRRVITEVLAGNRRGLVERLRELKARRDRLQAEAVEARDEAAALEGRRQEVYTRTLEGQEAQRRLQAAWEKRMSTIAGGGGNVGDNIGDASELDRAIAAQRARQGPVAPAPSSSGRMIWPAQGPITDTYGYLKSRGRNHWGIDVGAPTGAPVVAALGGRVVTAGWMGSYGNIITIDHPDGLETRYAHLSRISVNVGQTVNQGQTIGAVGSTGNSTGPHLHFEVYQNGAHSNPMNHLPAR